MQYLGEREREKKNAVRNTHQHTANVLFNSFLCALCASVCRFHDAAQRLGSPLRYPCDVVLGAAACGRQHHFVPTTTVKMSQPETADARPLTTRAMNDLVTAMRVSRSPLMGRCYRGSHHPLNLATINVRQPGRHSRINSVPSAGGPCQLTIVGD